MGSPEGVVSASPRKTDNPSASSQARDAFGRLPLSFEANEGQTDPQVLFLTRGHDYSLFLTAGGAVFSFNGESAPLQMRLHGAAATPRVSGLDKLPGKVNYLIGNKSEQWRTNISTYARVRYEEIYDGVGLVYYGNQRQLEYDFEVAPHASFKQIRLAFDGGGKLKLNRSGDLVWQAGARKLTLLRPRAYQEIGGTRHAIAVRYRLTSDGQVGFQIGKYDCTQPLVIDPVLSYSTYLGGSGSDQAQSIALDAAGNAYITGQTSSPNFPTTPALPASGTDAFVTKLNAAGTALVYSTIVGGGGIDIGTSIACDGSGNAHVVGQTSSSDFPLFTALHPTFGGVADAFVVELNPSGSAPVFSTYLGGKANDFATSIALDSSGNAYVSGATSSFDFPTTNPLQAHRAGNSIFKTTNAAGSWTASDSGLLAGRISDLVFDPSNSSIIYAATDGGIYKTTDGGANWTALSGQPASPPTKLAIDPSNANIIYTAGDGGFSKSTDGGNTFTAINNGLNPVFARGIVIDPVTPTTVYGIGVTNLIVKSTDGGATWVENFINTSFDVNALLIDPNTPTTIYAATSGGMFKSTNAAGTWAASNTGFPFSFIRVNALAIDKTNNLLYAATNNGLFKSANAAASWANINGNLPPFTSSLVVPDPTNSSIIYQVTSGFVFKTTDAGSTWTISNTGIPTATASALLLNPTQPATLYLAAPAGSDAFVTKLSAGGTSQIYSTFLGGNLLDTGNGIAVDASGNAYVVGLASSSDFPTVNAIQPARDANSSDAFVAKLNASGSGLIYSTFLGGNSNDSARAVAVDGSGNAYITGTTLSSNFPTANAFQSANPNFSNEVFVTKINPAGSSLVFSTYLGGRGGDDGFDIAVDATGSAYVTGSTNSFDFPMAGAFQPTLSGPSDAFVTKFAPNGLSLVYSTYIGGSNAESAFSLALDSSNNVCLVGSTTSSNFPTLNPLQAASGGGFDAFVAKLTPAPELVLTISDSPDPVLWGEDLTYTINVTNNGDAAATGVAVGDTVAEGGLLVSATSTQGTCTGSQAITCAIGTLDGGAAATVTLVIKPPPVRTVNNTAFVTLNETDAFAPNNTASTQTLVDFADVAIIKNAAQGFVAPGGTLTYSLIAKNNGGISAPVIVTDNLPAGTSLVHCATTGSGVCGGSGNNVTVQIPTLAPNQSQAILLTVGVSGSATVGTVISNTASINSPLPDTDVISNSSTASVTVATVPLLQKSNGVIAFAADRAFTPVSEPSGIYTVKPDGTGEKLFPNIPPDSWRPVWSPDGSKLAFQKFVSPSSDISIINADGTGLTKVVNNAAGFRKTMSWSPNGKQIAYIGTSDLADPDHAEGIHIVNVDGSGFYRLPGSPGFLTSVDWSPDGSKFVYSNGAVISVINADGTGITPLTTVQMTNDGPTRDTEPHWSPDGTRIIFTRSTTNSNAIYAMNADGTNIGQFFNFFGLQADWSPDGLAIVFQQGNEICTANTNGTNFKCVTNNIYYEFDPHWQELPASSPTPSPTPTPSFIHFAASSFSVNENAGSREIVVTRTGDVSGAVTVNYATSDSAGLVACTVVNGKGSERCDYETAVGTLRFAAGETSKSFTVPIVDDAHVEGSETFNVTLSNPVGATTNFPASAFVTITDNDATPSMQNPIDGVQFFVTQQYIDFLGRLPDPIGLANWTATLNGCPNGGFGENDNPDCDRVHVSAGFFLSDEFRGRGYWAYRFYEVGFDRRPLYAEFVPDMAEVGGPQSPASELLSKAAYTAAFAQRTEFINRYNALSNSAYVNALEQNAEITLSNKAALIAALDGNQKTRADVLREIVESKDVEDRFFIRAFVSMQYFGYLRRDPDTIGYNNWVTALTADPGNFRHMIFGFIFSTEYRGRFGVQ